MSETETIIFIDHVIIAETEKKREETAILSVTGEEIEKREEIEIVIGETERIERIVTPVIPPAAMIALETVRVAFVKVEISERILKKFELKEEMKMIRKEIMIGSAVVVMMRIMISINQDIVVKDLIVNLTLSQDLLLLAPR
jgi:hypothetical protein